MLFNKEKQGTLKNLAGKCYLDLFVVEMITSSIPEPTWGWFAHLHLYGSVPTCIYRTLCCSPWAGLATDYFRSRSCSSAVGFDLPQQEVAGCAGLSFACSSFGLQAELPDCCSSTALRNRLLPVHQAMFIVLPHAGLAWMLGHEEPRAHDPPALAAGSVLTTGGIRNDRDKRDCNRALAFPL